MVNPRATCVDETDLSDYVTDEEENVAPNEAPRFTEASAGLDIPPDAQAEVPIELQTLFEDITHATENHSGKEAAKIFLELANKKPQKQRVPTNIISSRPLYPPKGSGTRSTTERKTTSHRVSNPYKSGPPTLHRPVPIRATRPLALSLLSQGSDNTSHRATDPPALLSGTGQNSSAIRNEPAMDLPASSPNHISQHMSHRPTNPPPAPLGTSNIPHRDPLARSRKSTVPINTSTRSMDPPPRSGIDLTFFDLNSLSLDLPTLPEKTTNTTYRAASPPVSLSNTVKNPSANSGWGAMGPPSSLTNQVPSTIPPRDPPTWSHKPNIPLESIDTTRSMDPPVGNDPFKISVARAPPSKTWSTSSLMSVTEDDIPGPSRFQPSIPVENLPLNHPYFRSFLPPDRPPVSTGYASSSSTPAAPPSRRASYQDVMMNEESFDVSMTDMTMRGSIDVTMGSADDLERGQSDNSLPSYNNFGFNKQPSTTNWASLGGQFQRTKQPASQYSFRQRNEFVQGHDQPYAQVNADWRNNPHRYAPYTPSQPLPIGLAGQDTPLDRMHTRHAITPYAQRSQSRRRPREPTLLELWNFFKVPGEKKRSKSEKCSIFSGPPKNEPRNDRGILQYSIFSKPLPTEITVTTPSLPTRPIFPSGGLGRENSDQILLPKCEPCTDRGRQSIFSEPFLPEITVTSPSHPARPISPIRGLGRANSDTTLLRVPPGKTIVGKKRSLEESSESESEDSESSESESEEDEDEKAGTSHKKVKFNPIIEIIQEGRVSTNGRTSTRTLRAEEEKRSAKRRHERKMRERSRSLSPEADCSLNPAPTAPSTLSTIWGAVEGLGKAIAALF